MDLNFETKHSDQSSKKHEVEIWIKKRSNKKYITEVKGLDSTLDWKGILKKLKRKVLFCNGTIQLEEDGSTSMILQGDHRELLVPYLVKEVKIDESSIVIHGV